MILAYLVLAHLLSDFLLQPTRLVVWKIKSKKGTFIHSFIHTIVALIILIPFLINGYYQLIYVVLGISFVHFWIDEAKINYALKHDNKIKPFVIDQILHLFTIVIAFLFVRNIDFNLPDTQFYQTYTDPKAITIVLLLVSTITIIEILRLRKKRTT